MKNTSSNARLIPDNQSHNLLRFVFFQELSQSEWAAYKELARQAKETPVEEPVRTNLK